jgi:hypothetical protein
MLAINLALQELERDGKVLYFADRPDDFSKKLDLLMPSLQIGIDAPLDRLVAVGLASVNQLWEALEHLPFAFPRFEQQLASDADELQAVRARMQAISAPSMIVVDELTRLYGRQVLPASEPREMNKRLALQLGILAGLTRERDLRTVLLSGTRITPITPVAPAESGDEEDGQEATMQDMGFKESPVAHGIVEYYSEIEAWMTWTSHPGERVTWIQDKSDTQISKPRLMTMDKLFAPHTEQE